MKKESDFQTEIKEELEEIFFCTVIKNDTAFLDSYPDLSINFWNGKHALLEVKRYKGAPEQPNQRFYINQTNMSGGFARFIYPENKERIFDELKEVFASSRKTRLPFT